MGCKKNNRVIIYRIISESNLIIRESVELAARAQKAIKKNIYANMEGRAPSIRESRPAGILAGATLVAKVRYLAMISEYKGHSTTYERTEFNENKSHAILLSTIRAHSFKSQVQASGLPLRN